MGAIDTGPAGFELIDEYTGITGPASFGWQRGPTVASSGSGDTVGIIGSENSLAVPAGYVSGGALADTSTYDNRTLSSLGATPGVYVYTFGSGRTADSFTVDIAAAPVPEPASALLLGLPLGLVMLLGARHRRATRDDRVRRETPA